MTELSPAIEEGLRVQRRLLEQAIAAGEVQAGWKVGFGSPSGLALLGLDGPIIGHLLSSGEFANASTVSIDGWTRPVIEAEIAVWIGSDIPAGTGPDAIGAYVRALGPAIELADLDHSPEDVTRILAGNIFHRSYLLGEADEAVSLEEAGRLNAVFEHGEERIDVAEPSALTGDLAAVLARTAALAPSLGRDLRAGDVVLMGSIIVPRPVSPGDACRYRLAGFPSLSVNFAAS